MLRPPLVSGRSGVLNRPLLPERHLESYQRESKIPFVLPNGDRGAIGGEIVVAFEPHRINQGERQPKDSREADHLAGLIDRELTVPQIAQRNLGLHRRGEIDIAGEGPGQDGQIRDMVIAVPRCVDEDRERAPDRAEASGERHAVLALAGDVAGRGGGVHRKYRRRAEGRPEVGRAQERGNRIPHCDAQPRRAVKVDSLRDLVQGGIGIRCHRAPGSLTGQGRKRPQHKSE